MGSLDAYLNLKIRQWNKSAEKLYGWKEDEIKNHSVLELYSSNNEQDFKKIGEFFIGKKDNLQFESLHKHKNQTLFWVDVSYAPIFNKENELIAIAVIVEDISKRKEAFNALEASEGKLRSFIATTHIWIWEMDLSLQYTYSNLAEEITGYQAEELKKIRMASLAIDSIAIEEEMRTCIEVKKGWIHRLWSIKHKNGRVIWLESNGNPIFNAKGDLIGFRGTDRDITDQVNMEKSKDEFLSMVSHELRTPLTSIIGALGLLKAREEPGMPTDVKELLSLANRNAEKLLGIVNDILDVQKLQLGKLKLHLTPVVLAKVIHDATQLMQTYAMANKTKIVLGSMIPNIQVYVDYDRLLQVMLNLVSNAIKFSFTGGEIKIDMELHGENIHVSIEDWGKGVASKIQHKIFERFTQEQVGDTRLKGTGLGLNICKNLIEQMGGKIGFIAKPQVGSIFYFDLPIIK